MTCATISSHRFFNTHFFVTFHALAMVSRHQSRLERIALIKGLAMAAATCGRLFGCRAIMMATLTKRVLVSMKIMHQLVIFNMA
jgi:hypothetical protein